jgi:hypothetical protein
LAYNYNKLRGRIVEKFGTNAFFASKLGVSERTLSLKLNNKRFFLQEEITKAAKLLEIGDEEIVAYFFNQKVQSN